MMKKIKFLILFMFICSFLLPVKIFAEFEGWVFSKWDTWYCYRFNITNSNQDHLSNWNITFTIPENSNMYEKWSWNFEKNKGTYTITPLDWNYFLLKWGSTEVWFCINNNQTFPENIKFSLDEVNTSTNLVELKNNSDNKNRWLFKGVDLLNKWKYDYMLALWAWNVLSYEWNMNMTYNKDTKVLHYDHEMKNIVQEKSSSWVHWYPNILLWKNPFGWNYTTWYLELPMKIKDIKDMIFTTKYSLSNISNWPLNFAAEWWIVKDKDKNTNVSWDEIEFMVLYFKEKIWAGWNIIWEVTIPITVDWKIENHKYEINKYEWEWDFFTFTPSRNFNWEEVKLNLADFIPSIKNNIDYSIDNHYLMDWSIWSEYWEPTTNYSTISWDLHKFDLDINWNDSSLVNDEFNVDSILDLVNDSDKIKLTFKKINFISWAFKDFQLKFDKFILNKISNYDITKYNNWVLLRDSILLILKDFEDKKIDKNETIDKLNSLIKELKKL